MTDGWIHSVGFVEETNPSHYYGLTVQIEADGSCTWKGFTCDRL